MKKVFDLAIIVFAAVGILVVACFIPRIFANADPLSAWATVGLVVAGAFGIIVTAIDFKKHGRIRW